jgi:hypothetical protein
VWCAHPVVERSDAPPGQVRLLGEDTWAGYEEVDAMSSSLASETPILLPQPATVLHSSFTNMRERIHGCDILEIWNKCIIFN